MNTTTELKTFANAALSAARVAPRKFGDKAFIHSVWAVARTGMSLDAFKSRLLDAHRAGLLVLSRADLVSAMNPEDVRQSDTDYMGLATFNLVNV